eukprot:149614_1
MAGPKAERPNSQNGDNKPPNYKLEATIGTHDKALCALRFSPDGGLLVSSGADNVIKLWKSSGEYVRALEGHTYGVNDLSWAADSQHLVSAGDEHICKVWDVETGKCLRDLKGHQSYVFCCRTNLPRGDIVASGSFDEMVKLWDLRQAKEMRTIAYHSEPVTTVDFTKDGTVVCSGSYDGIVRLSHVGSGACLKHFYAQNNPAVSQVRFSPNSNFILVSTLDGMIRLWKFGMDVNTRKPVKMYNKHENTNYSIFTAFAGDRGQWIVTGSEDNKVYIYDAQSMNVLQTLDDHDDAVVALSVHPKEPVLASGGMMKDRSIKLWRNVPADTDNN